MRTLPKSFAETKAHCCSHAFAVHQRGPNDTSGFERDRAWRAEVRRARGWVQLYEALPYAHPLRRMVEERACW